jgi:hypothetical protein
MKTQYSKPSRRAIMGGVLAALALTLVETTAAHAQVATRQTCEGRDPVGYIGISGVECNCTIGSPGSNKTWSFRTEPKVTSLEMDAPAGRLLRTGDVITHVNGKLITTRSGAQELANIRPGEPVVLTIRRNGLTQTYAMTPDAACPNDTRLLGIYAPEVPAVPAPTASARAGARGSTPRPSRPPSTPAPPATPRAVAGVVPRASFGMGLICSNCSIKVSEKNNTKAMSFSRPPEVYSIERDGPADKAGIRRGDVITHVDGRAIESSAGGNLFANARPGQTVKFTIQRGGERRTIPVRATARSAPSPQLTKSSESLERARASLSELQREQAEQMREIHEELKRSQRTEQDKLRELQRTMLKQEREHRARLSELAAELTRTEQRMRAAMSDSARAACPVPWTTATASARASRTLRYTGTIGDAEIEVRGANPVSVTESGDEIEISTAGTIVKLKTSKKN